MEFALNAPKNFIRIFFNAIRRFPFYWSPSPPFLLLSFNEYLIHLNIAFGSGGEFYSCYFI